MSDDFWKSQVYTYDLTIPSLSTSPRVKKTYVNWKTYIEIFK